MSKAILIMDMPSNCLECPCLNDVDECEGVYKDVDDIGRKPTWCPLREVPPKQEGFTANECTKAYMDGFNDCIDEILGGGE